ncbi:MAG TPA: B12-binding domain-containing radical SAM protein, partial [Anaerolineae bacterium]|nr:B12-binding domain-containing radical SAM protein [Anaerolineae bacterium]
VNALAQAMPDVKVFLFGAGLRYVWRQALQGSEAALAVLGEAEFDTPAVVEALASGRSYPLHRLEGVAYRVNGEIIHRPVTSLQGDLDALPYPAWDLLPHDRYAFLTLSASRGCDHGCAYCPYVAAQGGFRARSTQAVAAEARWLQRTFDIPRLVFRDPVFAANRDRTLELCQALRKARVRVGWECESRPEHFDPDLLYQMRRAGCQVIKLGLETVDDTLLWGVNRLLPGWTAARYRAHAADLVATCGRLGLRCRVFVMTGLPGQTVGALERTLAFLQALQAPAVSVKRYHPYPGTPLGEETGAVVGYPLLSEAELGRLENAMRATAVPPPPPRRSPLRRLIRRRGRG